MDISSSLDLFRRLRLLKQGVELQQLKLYVGNVGIDYGHMLRSPGWGENLAEVYDCNVLDESGKRKEAGSAWCEQLSPYKMILTG